ncbi:hypothetical protein M0804_013324 [Polistes exclamans]|nr:hypothetical protein M0804_013324 [Polistes exclamans]
MFMVLLLSAKYNCNLQGTPAMFIELLLYAMCYALCSIKVQSSYNMCYELWPVAVLTARCYCYSYLIGTTATFLLLVLMQVLICHSICQIVLQSARYYCFVVDATSRYYLHQIYAWCYCLIQGLSAWCLFHLSASAIIFMLLLGS